jgi:hypothetical protein
MSYVRFGLMIATSTVVMFVLMYLNTYAWEHVFFSETRAWMAILMGATMAIVMLAYMLGMYNDKRLNVAIFAGAGLAFALSLWLVRSQATVSGPAYMRAMIPHHSIAVLTSERANLRDPRVRKLAAEIIEAQRREIAEMRYLIAEVPEGHGVDEVYQDSPAEVGTLEDALNNTLVSTLDPAPLPEAEADPLLGAGPRCGFRLSPEDHPILWASTQSGAGAMKLNGVIVPLAATGVGGDRVQLAAPGVTMTVDPLAEEADWRSNAQLRFALDRGLTVGYGGFWACAGSGDRPAAARGSGGPTRL